MFAPVCSILDVPIPPCKHLCLSAKSGCEDIIRKFGFKWPDVLDCERLEKVNGMCVGENRTKSSENHENRELSSDENYSFKQSNKESELRAKLKNDLECPHMMKVLSKTR